MDHAKTCVFKTTTDTEFNYYIIKQKKCKKNSCGNVLHASSGNVILFDTQLIKNIFIKRAREVRKLMQKALCGDLG